MNPLNSIALDSQRRLCTTGAATRVSHECKSTSDFTDEITIDAPDFLASGSIAVGYYTPFVAVTKRGRIHG